MKIRYSEKLGLYVWSGLFSERTVPEHAGFTWHQELKAWVTASDYNALRLFMYAEGQAKQRLKTLYEQIQLSKATDSTFVAPVPPGKKLYPYQRAGIDYMTRVTACLLADEQGLGKTIQVAGLMNWIGARSALIICPANLRLNWNRELEEWLLDPSIILHPIMDGKTLPLENVVNIISYNLAARPQHRDLLRKMAFDVVVCDEAHFLKNPGASRTRAVLGARTKFGVYPGLIECGKRTLYLTGTPAPNRLPELYPILRASAHHLIDYKSYWSFVHKYAYVRETAWGKQIVGGRNQQDLYARLRSGFMVRRLKKDVLHELPEKRYKLVTFSPTDRQKKVLLREQDFSAREIAEHGVPAGTALPEIRREMGEAKVPQIVNYITDYLQGGAEKLVVFGHHRNVLRRLHEQLSEFCPELVYGGTPAAAKEQAVRNFQESSSCRVFIGQLVAAGVGITLTAAHDVILAEPSWVPGENDQVIDRLHRIGQKHPVLVHYLVVESSLDAKILGAAKGKREHVQPALDN